MMPRTIARFGALALTLFLVGCGEGRLILNVDILSFMDPADRDQPYGPIPAGVTGSTESEPFEFNTPAGLGGETLVESVTITASADLDNQTGSAFVDIEVFFDTLSATLYTGSPDIVVRDSLFPNTVTPITVNAVLADSILGLFNSPSVFAGVRFQYQSRDPLGGPDLQGVAHITQIDARIVASEAVF